MAMAPLRNTSRVMVLSPAISHTELSIKMSRFPTKGRVKPDAIVEIMTLGIPYGSVRITAVASVVPIEPPALITPAICPVRCKSSAILIAPCVMTA